MAWVFFHNLHTLNSNYANKRTSNGEVGGLSVLVAHNIDQHLAQDNSP